MKRPALSQAGLVLNPPELVVNMQHYNTMIVNAVV